jgi:hypothetical protein
LNVSVHIAPQLQGATEGRSRLEIGLPAGAGLGELLESLFALYPKLREFLAHEGARPAGQELSILLSREVDTLWLRPEEPVYLVASRSRRLTERAA